MKKIIVIAFLLFSSVQTQSQVLISLIFGDALNSGKIEFGLEGGYNWANFTQMDSKDYLGNYNLGFYFDIKIDQPWYIYTGVLVKSNLGTNKLSENDLKLINFNNYDADGEYSQVTKTFQVPALIKYRFENNFFLLAGLQFGLMYNAWIEYNYEDDNTETVIKEYNEDELNRIDAGGMVGFGYKIKKKNNHGLSFSLRYYYGFVDVYKNLSGPKYTSFFLEMTIPIGADKGNDIK